MAERKEREDTGKVREMFEEERKKYKGLMFVGWDYSEPNFEFWDWADVDEFIADREDEDQQDIINDMADECGGNFSHYSYVEPTFKNIDFYRSFAQKLKEVKK